MKESEKAPGVKEIFMPGEIEFNNEDYNLEHGIEIGQGVMRDLQILCDRYDIDYSL
jgi:LDH2 family malate/lactate/ureidoglycolate dehydrogenase